MYDILPLFLKMSGSSRFVSCAIAVKFWVKLQSPIGYTLVAFFFIRGSIFLMTLAVIIQSHKKSLLSTFFILAPQQTMHGWIVPP